MMGKKNRFFDVDRNSNPITSPNFRKKHAYSQVNGETMESQHNIILHNEVRKNS